MAVFARELAARVLRSAWPLPTAVVCDDHDVARFAEREGARVIWTPGLGLSGAVTAGVEHLRGEGFTLVTVAHSDLPRAEGLADIGEPGKITLVPDLRMNGTNVASVPAAAGFRFSYGEGSFERHKAEAARDRPSLSCGARQPVRHGRRRPRRPRARRTDDEAELEAGGPAAAAV